MPNYPHKCLNCSNKFDIFLTYEEYGKRAVSCPHCESADIQRIISRIRFARSEESRLENLADPSALEGIEDDPKALGGMMRKMSSEMGEEMGPEFDEVIDRLESGQSPEQIEEAIPDLAEDAGGPGMGGMDGF